MKITLINDAYSQLRISGLTVAPTPEDVELALNRMENMLNEWRSLGICVGYNFEETPEPNSSSGIDRSNFQAVSTNLAARLIADYGLTPSQGLALQASQSLSFIVNNAVKKATTETFYPNRMPVGSGNRIGRSRYYTTSNAKQECYTLYVGDKNDYIESFSAYLARSEVISTYTIESDMSILSDTSDDNTVSYSIEAVQEGNFAVQITITTDLGRITTREIKFTCLKPLSL